MREKGRELGREHDAPAGQNGPQVFAFAGAASPLNGTVPMNPRLVADFEATFLYVDIHGPASSEDTAGDQIRGQMGQPPVITNGTIRISVATMPAGGTGFTFTDDVPGSAGSFNLDDGDKVAAAVIIPPEEAVKDDDQGTLIQ